MQERGVNPATGRMRSEAICFVLSEWFISYQRSVVSGQSFLGTAVTQTVACCVWWAWRIGCESNGCVIDLERDKGIRWMPWHQEAMKDVARCEKPRGAASRR